MGPIQMDNWYRRYVNGAASDFANAILTDPQATSHRCLFQTTSRALSLKLWSIVKWMKVIWSDESSLELLPTTGRVQVWKTPAQVYNPNCVLSTVKYEGGSVRIWAAISRFSVRSIVTLKGKITGR
ncbi:DDE_3 domain-containing protein [Trichonephila clavipes]|nr:DDE_3 domain-containing protein [Trichonephila clavipes]